VSNPKSPPPRITGFTFIQGIGGGGFADVFLYTQHSTGRAVAVKVLRAEHLSEASLRQFETEARVMAGVSTHPFIVTIHDAGFADDGRPYLVMEHYPLPHFGRRAAGGHLPLSEVLRVSVQVCSAVETAHRAAILHRDIKPANVLTSTYGDPGLTDFGIAGVQTEQGMSSAAGVSYGFSAPEVILDDRSVGSISSDVYSLGATIYALLSGRSPIYIPGGDNSQSSLATRVANGELQPIRRDDLPHSLNHLISAALAANPVSRPTSAAALGNALRDIEQELRLSPTPLVVTGLTPGSPTDPTSRTHPPPDGDATRRAPRVVHAQQEPVPQQVQRPVPQDSPTPPSPPAHLATFASADPANDQTVARNRFEHHSDPAVSSFAPTPGIAPESISSTDSTALGDGQSKPPRILIYIGATAVILVAIVLSMIISGQSDNTQEAPTTITTSPPPLGDSGQEMGGQISPPKLTELTLQADGSVLVTWEQPPDLDGPASYTVYRTDRGGTNDVIAGPTLMTSATITSDIWTADPPGERGLCLEVEVKAGSRVETSDEHCVEVSR